MIQIRKNIFSENSLVIEFKEKETIKELVIRSLIESNYGDDPRLLDHFQILINGLKLDKDFWEITVVKESDTILIAPEIKRGEGAQIFKQIAIIGVVIAASILLSPGAGAAIGAKLGSAALVAGISIVTTILLNSIIPPIPLPGLGDIGSVSFESSQMYSINSQSNSIKKYGNVPKVYGRHRMYPLIAATPYTELDADEDTNAIVQFYNAVYDFGYGPYKITDIRIGNTPIGNFSDIEYALVDFKRPTNDGGVWDEDLVNDLVYYKGINEIDYTTYSLNRNKNESTAPLDEYTVVRSSAQNIDNVRQEIILEFICPEGLIAYGTNASTTKRNIDLRIRFRKEGTTAWRNFNDSNFVRRHSARGADNTISRNRYLTLRPKVSFFWDLIDVIEQSANAYYDALGRLTRGNSWYETKEYGIKKGKTFIDALPGLAQVGRNIFYQGLVLGKVASTQLVSDGYTRYFLEKPVDRNIIFFATTFVWEDKRKEVFLVAQNGYGIYQRTFNVDPNLNFNKQLYVNLFSPGEVIVSDRTTQQKYFSIRFEPKERGRFEIEVVRNRSYSTSTFQIFDKLTLVSVSTRFNKRPISTLNRHLFLDLKIRATNQINGAVQNLSAVVSSVLDVYNPSTQTWQKQVTNNPAWVFVDLLTGEINPKRISKDKLHLESILEWADFCDEVPDFSPDRPFRFKRFECNFILDFDTTLQNAINLVCNSAQASLNIIDGKYGVLIDRNRDIPVQIFTPRNSWDFSSIRNYSDPPHALKVKFVSPEKNWEVDEVLVYSDGFTKTTATEFEEINTFACTNTEQAWRYGRYLLAVSKLRQETITINVDFEYLVCTRGDYVIVTQDVMKVGGRPARVKSLVGNRVKIDDGIETQAVPYGYIFRGVNGIEQSTLTVVDSDEFDLDGPLPEVGDLIVIGPTDTVKFDCIVKEISPNDNLSATLVLVEKAPGIYAAESFGEIEDYTPQISAVLDVDLTPPPPVEELEVVENTWRVIGSAYQYYISIDWEIQTGVAFETFEIYVDSGSGYDLVDFTKESFYEYIVKERNLGVEHFFKVLAVSSTGRKIPLIEAPFVSATPIKKVTPPSDVEALYINITNQVIQLEWPRISDVDLKEYLLRYSPRSSGATWESSIPFARISGITNTVSVQGRTGTYFVKALDLNSNESSNSAQAVTSIPKLFDLNVISETNDFPSLPGEKDALEFDGAGLILKRLVSGDPVDNQYYPEGYYYYSEFLDLGEIYSVRLQSQIEAEGFTVDDLMSNWITLDQVASLANAGNASWDVETYYRGTESFNVMSEWVSLSSITVLSEGVDDNWTPWKKFTIGDFTFRIAQFRLKLISNVASVTPRVFNGVIKADMPDRFETYNNVNSSDLAPISILYDPAFKGPGDSPNIQITQDNAQLGDYFIISNKSLNGFEIIFYDLNNNPVVRQFDVAVKGYGRKSLAVI